MNRSSENQTDENTSIAPIDLARRNMRFELGDFLIKRRFKSFIQSLVVPDGLIINRIDKIAESILRDFGPDGQEINILVTQDNSLKFYRDLNKRLAQRGEISTRFRAFLIKETYVRSAKGDMNRVWKIEQIRNGG